MIDDAVNALYNHAGEETVNLPSGAHILVMRSRRRSGSGSIHERRYSSAKFAAEAAILLWAWSDRRAGAR